MSHADHLGVVSHTSRVQFGSRWGSPGHPDAPRLLVYLTQQSLNHLALNELIQFDPEDRAHGGSPPGQGRHWTPLVDDVSVNGGWVVLLRNPKQALRPLAARCNESSVFRVKSSLFAGWILFVSFTRCHARDNCRLDLLPRRPTTARRERPGRSFRENGMQTGVRRQGVWPADVRVGCKCPFLVSICVIRV